MQLAGKLNPEEREEIERMVREPYRSFGDLVIGEEEGRDYRIRIALRRRSVLVMAPHGGRIEPGTTEIAEAIAGNDLSFYSFEGIKADGNGVLHIQSRLFDEPRAMERVKEAEIVVTVHGHVEKENEFVMLGGLNACLKSGIESELRRSGFQIREATPGLTAMNPANICNRGRLGKGIQIEISRKLRDSLRTDDDRLRIFADTIRRAIQRKVFMKKVEPKRFSEFIEIALRAGATAVRVIPSRWVVIDERVRLKCEIPRCAGYGRFLTCPPHVMSVGAFSRIRSGYKWGLLVQVEAKNIDSTEKSKRRIDQAILKENEKLHHPFKLKLLEIVEAVESAAFKKGIRFAAGLVGGSCVLCERCVTDKFSQACRHPFRARPPMEAVGIDVVKTAQNAGLPIHLSSSKEVLWTGLVLLD